MRAAKGTGCDLADWEFQDQIQLPVWGKPTHCAAAPHCDPDATIGIDRDPVRHPLLAWELDKDTPVIETACCRIETKQIDPLRWTVHAVRAAVDCLRAMRPAASRPSSAPEWFTRPPRPDAGRANAGRRPPGRGLFSYSKWGLVGRGRTISRVLYPLQDGDHLSGTPVARHL